mmetsp:Transcript_13141/g.15801  ORF Transcript_13141/g.15801 Transcript_13141/m.15801 type:complete len:227 (+) Transcript_13141:42-722(+)|eukprot:CAMPEP_0195331600 /NCGR_PEP_ID=MMETSP0708-20121125/12725_1 /TAXON_ID=33640 /ORGANISM="Asterionellopsis glacialis, Strain CCMP134" /LENGTH=226 /DNA_ID=CAMNT_0040400091 /DNA_START=24 /DNA_END=704 /DNA_ORIENTATION=-
MAKLSPMSVTLLVVVMFQTASSFTNLALKLNFGRPSSPHFATVVSKESSNADVVDDEAYQPYAGVQAPEALPDIFVPNVLPEGVDEELLWVPQTDSVSFRPLCFCASSGYYVNLLRVRGAGLLSRHKHPGPVHGHVLKGSWKYLEHDWVAKEGSYVFEPPGEIHTLVVPEGVEEMITLFHVTGSLLYCDTQGTVVGAEDVFTKLELAKKHYAEVGLGEDFVQQFVR